MSVPGGDVWQVCAVEGAGPEVRDGLLGHLWRWV
ncbi:MAG: hypothetical protein QOI78_6753 [Actinomycetota bacterium]|nr:hypothetical protein [Actinomycetota bacterium]